MCILTISHMSKVDCDYGYRYVDLEVGIKIPRMFN